MQEELSFAEIKQLFREIATSQKEITASQKDTEARFKDTEARFKDTEARFKDTEARFKETDKQIKRAFDLFESQWGKLIESLVEGDLIRLLNERGIEVHDTSLRRKGSHKGQNFEFDIIAKNGNEIVIVEVKTTLRVKHVREFIEKLGHAREWLNEYRTYNIYGAMAFLRAEEASDILADKEQLFVIKATGNSASIVNTDSFKPKNF